MAPAAVLNFDRYVLKTKNNFSFRLQRNALHAVTFAGLVLLSTLFSVKVSAQSSVAGERFLFPQGSVNDGTTVVGPLHRGFSASIPVELTHDSQSGWADMAFLTATYHINAALSADVTLPYYMRLNAVPVGGGELVTHNNVFGDVIIAGRYHTDIRGFDYTLTGATTAHNGDQSLALGAGRMTGLIANHVERSVGYRIVADGDLAYGNSSELMRESTRKNYLSVGKLGFIQAGGSLLLPRAMNLDAHVYDQVPLGTQFVISTVIRKDTNAMEFSNESAAEDYGLSAKLGLPVTQRLGVAATYNHSVTLNDTVVGFNLTLLLHKGIDRNE